MYNDKTTTIRPDQSKMFEIFQDRKREMPDHITATVKEDIEHFQMALWGARQIKEEADLTPEDLGNLVIQYQELSSKLSKLLDLAKLSQYATGFNIPDHLKLSTFTIEDIATNEEKETIENDDLKDKTFPELVEMRIEAIEGFKENQPELALEHYKELGEQAIKYLKNRQAAE